MSTYEQEHNLNRSSSDDSTNQNHSNTSSGNNNGRHRPTLQQALNNFLNTPSYATTNLIAFDNPDSLQVGGIPVEPQMMEMLTSMIRSSNGMISLDDSNQSKGVDDAFLDTLERVDVKKLKDDDTCPICTNDYKSDPHPLVVELPCNSKHRFDLECIGPWLKLNKTCPLCRTDVTIKKNKVEYVDSEEEEDGWDMYG